MPTIQLQGLLDAIPVKIAIDPSLPCSSISERFLFKNDMNHVLNSSGFTGQHVSLSVPTLGGYYTSKKFYLHSCFVAVPDVVLGSEWLSQTRASASGNVLAHPAPQVVADLQDGHAWTANGASSLDYFTAC